MIRYVIRGEPVSDLGALGVRSTESYSYGITGSSIANFGGSVQLAGGGKLYCVNRSVSMKLSSEQKEMVALFLRKQDEMLIDLRSDKRVQALSQIKQRIRDELLGLGVDSVTNTQVESLLRRMTISVKPKKSLESALEAEPAEDTGPEAEAASGVESKGKEQDSSQDVSGVDPEDESLNVGKREWKAEASASGVAASEEVEASEAVKEPDEADAEEEQVVAEPDPVVEIDGDEDVAEDFGGRHWLGVCDNMSVQTGWSVGMIRFLFVALGCFTGPVAILVYLAAFALGTQRHPGDYPTVDDGRVVVALLRLLGIAGGVFAVSWGLEFFAAIGFLEYFGQLPEIGVWGRMGSYGAESLLVVLVLLSPLAALGALPLAYRWGNTFSTIVNAGLAIYLVVIGLGVASTMFGYLLGALTQLAG